MAVRRDELSQALQKIRRELLTNEEKLARLNELFPGEFKQFVEDMRLYVHYKDGHDVKQTYDEVMTRGLRAYLTLNKLYAAVNVKSNERKRMVDNIAEYY